MITRSSSSDEEAAANWPESTISCVRCNLCIERRKMISSIVWRATSLQVKKKKIVSQNQQKNIWLWFWSWIFEILDFQFSILNWVIQEQNKFPSWITLWWRKCVVTIQMKIDDDYSCKLKPVTSKKKKNQIYLMIVTGFVWPRRCTRAAAWISWCKNWGSKFVSELRMKTWESVR